MVPAPFFAATCPVMHFSCAVKPLTRFGDEDDGGHPRHLPLQDLGERNGTDELRPL
jgi:hypothetical protein